jgi:ketosteroid isomerase-like protein
MTLVLRKQDEQWKILAAQNGSAEDRSSLGSASLRTGDAASLPARAARGDAADDKDRIHAALAAFDAAWNHRDRGALARLFAGNADFVDTAARWLEDPQVIANHILDKEVPSLGGPTRTSGVEKLSMLYSDLAVVLQRWNLQPSDPSGLIRQGMGLRVVEDHGQGWRILAAEDTLIRASS